MLKQFALAAVLAAPALAAADPYVVLGVASGKADLSDLQDTFTPGVHTVDDNYVRALVGAGLGVNRNLALEAAYLTDGKVSVSEPGRTDTLKASGLQLSVIGLAPLTPQFSLFGKLTANYLRLKWSTNPVPSSQSDVGFRPGFGVGMQFRASDAVGVRLAAERIQVRDAFPSHSDSDLDEVSLAVQYAF